MTASDSIVSVIDPAVLAMPLEECNEAMIDLIGQSALLFGPSPEIPDNHDYTKIRMTVYEKLLTAQEHLPDRFRFCLYEGYRSLTLQSQLFDQRFQIIQQQYPDWTHDDVFQESVKLVCPVLNLDGSLNMPPHTTGGAIDIYLVDQHGAILDMGIRAADWMQDLDGSLSQTISSAISETARCHRAIMSQVLEDAGFVNYPGEYWHWSFGDKYWAYRYKKPFALYGSV